MPAEIGLLVLPVAVMMFTAAVVAVLIGVIVSRAIRLSRGGPDAERLRQQLLTQHRSTLDGVVLHDGGGVAQEHLRIQQDVLQQQIIADAANPPGGSPPAP